MENLAVFLIFFCLSWCAYWSIDGFVGYLIKTKFKEQFPNSSIKLPERQRFHWIIDEMKTNSRGEYEYSEDGSFVMFVGAVCVVIMCIPIFFASIGVSIPLPMIIGAEQSLLLYLGIFLPTDVISLSRPWRNKWSKERQKKRQADEELRGTNIQKRLEKIRLEILEEIKGSDVLQPLAAYVNTLVQHEVPRRLEIRCTLLKKLPRAREVVQLYPADVSLPEQPITSLENRLKETEAMIGLIEQKLLLTLPLILNVKTSIDGGKIFAQETIADFDRLTKSVNESVAEIESDTSTSMTKQLDDELARAQAQMELKRVKS